MESTTKAAPVRELLSPDDLAAYLGVGRTTAYALLHDGTIPSLKIRALRRVRKQDVDAFLERCMEGR